MIYGNKETNLTYKEIKAAERKRAEEFIDWINNMGNPIYYDNTSYAITDLKDMLNLSVERYGRDAVAYKQRFVKGEPFGEVTFGQVLDRVNALGTAMLAHGLKDKRVAVIGENCYQWGLSYLATVCGTGVIVPLDKELGASDLEGIIGSAEVEAVFFTKKYLSIFEDIRERGETKLRILVNMNAEENDAEKDVYAQKALIAEGENMIKDGNRSFIDAEVDAEKMSILLYTSGTTGIAKGVMLCQRNICYNLMSSPNMIRTTPEDVFFSILPMHHTYECTCDFLMPIYKGSPVVYCEGLKYIQKNLQETKPTRMLGVPLIFESLYKAIWKNIRKQGKEQQVRRILKFSEKTGKLGQAVNRKLLKDIYDVFGGNLDLIIAGGAPMDPEILQFFKDLGIDAVQGYGLTECSPMVALNSDRFSVNHSAGYPLPGVEFKIIDKAEDGTGEICVKGDNVMLGYYNMPEETAKVLEDGWFHTGDLGYLDEEGYVYITGRKKNVIITRNGKNVFPEELEYILGKSPFVSESMVWADSDEDGYDDTIIATIKPDMEEVEKAIGKEDAKDESKIKELLQKEVDKMNDGLPIFKQIRKVALHMDDFEMTTGHKIKRFVESNKRK